MRYQGNHRVEIEMAWEAGHRLSCSSCPSSSSPHGHSYRAWIAVSSASLNDQGMVIDFSDLKGFIREWIDLHWDHAFICNDRDPLFPLLRSLGEKLRPANNTSPPYSDGGFRLWTFSGKDPTAEAMAQHLYTIVKEWLPYPDISVDYVTVAETLTSKATYRE